MITTEDARKRSDNCYGVNPETNQCFSSRNLCSAVNERSANDPFHGGPTNQNVQREAEGLRGGLAGNRMCLFGLLRWRTEKLKRNWLSFIVYQR